MTRLAPTERASLCDLLELLGPDEPTLCEGWRTRDLAAHLVLREGRPDAMPGIALPALAPWTKRVQDSIAGGDFRRLVGRLRAGPPLWSPVKLFEEQANGVEFFVHHEDVRRAQPDWRPRTLSGPVDEELWRQAKRLARFSLRKDRDAVDLVRANTGERHHARDAAAGGASRTVTGTSSELLMYLFGRRDHALVEVS
ncbi:MAG TPA: TIGR03085 family metal-binding protein [Acidothermaceae bacterium]|nr:TIGR03085 family metal-binding protein [Acidothermaceae bacterium]